MKRGIASIFCRSGVKANAILVEAEERRTNGLDQIARTTVDSMRLDAIRPIEAKGDSSRLGDRNPTID